MPRERLAPLDRSHAENAGLLAWLRRGREASEPIARPSAVAEPELTAGSHPDVVEHVWHRLGRGLPRACRALVHGTPALVHERAGIVLALALGTQYALRVPRAAQAAAEAAGLVSAHRYRTSGEALDLAHFGPAWRFGAWSALEPGWVLEEHERLGAPEPAG